MLSIKDQRVTIVGARRSGFALVRLVTALNGRARLTESGGEDCLLDEKRPWTLREKIEVEFNGHTREFIAQSDIVVVSPGVPIDAQPIVWAKELGIPVLGEIEFAFQFCDRPVIAVTGSNGKTTVSTLIHLVLQAAGYQSCLCGNIGAPFSDFVLDLEGKDFVVLEVSSFQMEALVSFADREKFPFVGFKPHVAVLLNFSQNHLDRHKDLEEYFQAKSRIFLNQDAEDYSVVNGEDEKLVALAAGLKSQVVQFSQQTGSANGLLDPNHLAVLQVAKVLEIAPKVCQDVFATFKGVEHRMEWVRNIDGVDFINDSKATTAEASRWALEHISQPIVMICGGKDKNIDFSVLKDLVKQKVRKMIVIGEASEKIRNTFEGSVSVEKCDLLESAVLQAKASAKTGDCVVLTPMCASFDMFKNFEERGQIFKEIVAGLV